MALTFNYEKLRYEKLRSNKRKEKELSYAEHKQRARINDKNFVSKAKK